MDKAVLRHGGPLLPAAITIPLEAALRTVEYANKSTSFRDTDWGGLAQRARNWFMGQDGKGLGAFPLNPDAARMSRLRARHLQAYARSHRGRQRGGILGGWKYV